MSSTLTTTTTRRRRCQPHRVSRAEATRALAARAERRPHHGKLRDELAARVAAGPNRRRHIRKTSKGTIKHSFPGIRGRELARRIVGGRWPAGERHAAVDQPDSAISHKHHGITPVHEPVAAVCGCAGPWFLHMISAPTFPLSLFISESEGARRARCIS